MTCCSKIKATKLKPPTGRCQYGATPPGCIATMCRGIKNRRQEEILFKLYDMPLALNCYKLRLPLSLLNVPHEKHPIDLLNGEHKSPAFLKLNPFAQLPVLVDGDLVLRDSQAILVGLARKFGGDRWMPPDVNDEALVNGWLSAAAFDVWLGPCDARLAKRFPTLRIDATGAAQRSAHALQLLNDRLTGRDWPVFRRVQANPFR